MSKYLAKKTMCNGILFDSKAEAKHYSELKLLEKAGIIASIELQPKYLILDGYKCPLTGRKIPATTYTADFLVTYADGRTEVVDVKSEATKTPVYRLKRKMFESKYGIGIVEVY